MDKEESEKSSVPMRPDGKECKRDCGDCSANGACNGQRNMIGTGDFE